ncbi:Fe-S protein assembly co-chaperone HscB [Biformimicrobium ophioploci]|uniref:Co-chaperone protein HscB homolog n=1 Tax=Biformimicrobium ophioploci TaxID=3036711 RepID=A0ABQ6LZ73_9GAMM|nr:Fe-S protein assembly co-chaperone HscB [Microbulbifer sp. NKW57]GMG87389.1 co-chaperone HscB [Microbulbifer sp. NKW57]
MSFIDGNQNYFQIFGLEPTYRIDTRALAGKLRQLQQQVHPDRFASGTPRERRLAEEAAALVNDAHTTLTDPALRAAYLLKMAGLEISANQTTADMDFLMQQMALREELEAVRSASDPERALEALMEEVEDLLHREEETFTELYESADYPAAEATLARLQFLFKLRHQAEDLEAQLFDD